MQILEKLLSNINYIGATALFLIGIYIIITNNNILKKVIGLNIMETSVFLFFVSIGYITGGSIPIINIEEKPVLIVNPLPSALILTGIVVSVSITAYCLSLVVKIYGQCKTMEMNEIIKEMRKD